MSDVDITDIDVAGEDIAEVTESCYLRGPPGTGKTTQSMARVHRLLSDHGYDINDVAWVTYRRKLAQDTLERLSESEVIDEDELEEPTQGATRHIGTFHSVAFRLLKDNLPREVMLDFGVDPRDNLEAAGTSDKIAFCKYRDLRYFTENPWDTSVGTLIFRIFEWLQNNLYDPSDPDDVRKCEYVSELREEHGYDGSITKLWEEWQEFKHGRGKIGFAEMLRECLDRGIHLRNRDVLIVDEFHDATPLMAEVAKMWAETANIVIVAGDEDQIVNAYAGPSRTLFHDIREELNLPEVLLDHSWRVSEEHWQAATQMLVNAHSPPDISREGRGRIVEHTSPLFRPNARSEKWGQVPAPSAESSPVHLHESTEGSLMFLARMRIQVAGISAALDRDGVIHRSQRDLGGWLEEDDDRLPIHNALQKLRQADTSEVLSGASSRLSQYQTDTRPLDTISLTPSEADRLLYYTPAKHLGWSRSKIEDIREELVEDGTTLPLNELNEHVQQSFWKELTDGAKSVRALNKRSMSDSDRKSLQKALSRYEDAVDESSVDVSVQTIHAAKGGEAEHVAVYDGISRRIESEMQIDPVTRDNEWRTWYVALTRASDTLHIMRDGFSEMGVQSIIPDTLLSSVRQSLQQEGGQA